MKTRGRVGTWAMLCPLPMAGKGWSASSPPCLTRQLAVPGHSLGHEAACLMQAHHVGNLLLALLGTGPGQCRQRILAHDLALGGEAVVRGLRGALHTSCISMWWEASCPNRGISSCCPTQVLTAWGFWGWGRRDPPAGSVPAGYCPDHLGHRHTQTLRAAPPAPVPSPRTASPPR